jgi:hypothetical protein
MLRLRRLTLAEWALLAVLVATSMSVFAVQAIDAAVNNRVYLGADGLYPYDQLQYLAWATDAAHHGLIADLYTLGLGRHVFLHPVWLVTGWLHVHGGLSFPLLLVAWKLAVLAALFLMLRAYARSVLDGGDAAVLVALAVALFMLSPSQVIVNRIAPGSTGPVNLELFAVYWLQGYFPIALAVVAMLGFLMAADVLLAGATTRSERRRARVGASAAGVTAAWLHPWQGVTLLVILAGLAVWERRSWRALLPLTVPALATLLPVLYYAVLRQTDAGWKQAEHYNASALASRQTLAILIAVLPVVVLMLPGYAVRARTSAERMLLLWPVAIAIVYTISPSDRWHALGGYSVPAAILIVRGWPWVRSRLAGWSPRRVTAVAIAGICVAVAAAPALVGKHVVRFRSGDFRNAEIARGDARALDSVATAAGSGGVLTTGDLGAWVPAVTGRPTWVGHETWTPSYSLRAAQVARLFSGALDHDPALERAFVRSTGATVVLEPCGSRAQLGPALAPEGFTATRVDCAMIYAAA